MSAYWGLDMGNKKLDKAKKNKVDEFYTQLSDIEAELIHYKGHFEGKVVFCNCDDPYESNFFKYFAINFNHLKLKKLIATCFVGSPITGNQLSLFEIETLNDEIVDPRMPYKIEITEVSDLNEDGAIDLVDVEILLKNKKNTLTLLKGTGDFRSEECVELLKESDIVVTNPPFSLFREYIQQLIEFDKRFIVIGNKNAITYKDVFSKIQQNQIWTGYRGFSGGMWFYVPDDYLEFDKTVDGKKLKNVPSIWFTNLDHSKRHETITLFRKFNHLDYPKYENYDAIDISKTIDIPFDYDGFMGVPISFIDKYNPDQFKLIGLGISSSGLEIGVRPYTIEHKRFRKEIQKRAAVDGDLYLIRDGEVDVPYARIIIQKAGKKNEN